MPSSAQSHGTFFAASGIVTQSFLHVSGIRQKRASLPPESRSRRMDVCRRMLGPSCTGSTMVTTPTCLSPSPRPKYLDTSKPQRVAQAARCLRRMGNRLHLVVAGGSLLQSAREAPGRRTSAAYRGCARHQRGASRTDRRSHGAVVRGELESCTGGSLRAAAGSNRAPRCDRRTPGWLRPAVGGEEDLALVRRHLAEAKRKGLDWERIYYAATQGQAGGGCASAAARRCAPVEPPPEQQPQTAGKHVTLSPRLPVPRERTVDLG